VDAHKKTLEAWLDGRHPNAEEVLRTVRNAWISGQPATGAQGQVDAILRLILGHARRDHPYRVLFNRGRLKAHVPDLSEEDLELARGLATRAALNAAEDVLHGRTTFTEASHASQIRTAMRRVMREVARQYGIGTATRLKPQPVDEVEDRRQIGSDDLAITGPMDTTEGTDEADRAAQLRRQVGRELVGVVEGGHSVTTTRISPDAFRPYWRDWPSNVLCLQCHRPRPSVESWQEAVTSEGTRRQVAITDSEPDFRFCSLACEQAFFVGPQSVEAVTRPEARVLGRALVAIAQPGNPGASVARARQVMALPGERLIGLTRRAIRDVRRQVTHSVIRKRAQAARQEDDSGHVMDAEAVAEEVLVWPDSEIWRHRNDGRGSVAMHLADLASRGVHMTATNYRQRRFGAKKKVDQALAAARARRVLGAA